MPRVEIFIKQNAGLVCGLINSLTRDIAAREMSLCFVKNWRSAEATLRRAVGLAVVRNDVEPHAVLDASVHCGEINQMVAMKIETQLDRAAKLRIAALIPIRARDQRTRLTMQFGPETILLLTGLIGSGLFVLAWPVG